MLATANKNFLIKIYKMLELSELYETEDNSIKPGAFNNMECIKRFKTPN